LLTLQHERRELPSHHLCARPSLEQLALRALRNLQPLQDIAEPGTGQHGSDISSGLHTSDQVAERGRDRLLLRDELLRVVELLRFSVPARNKGEVKAVLIHCSAFSSLRARCTGDEGELLVGVAGCDSMLALDPGFLGPLGERK
jgi:hypothetical protein